MAANDVGYIAMMSGDYAAAERLFADAIRLSPRYYDSPTRTPPSYAAAVPPQRSVVQLVCGMTRTTFFS